MSMVIKFAKYAFRDLLKQLYYSGINEITVTKEDNDLEVVISDKYLEAQKVELTNDNQKCCIVEMDCNGLPKLNGVISATKCGTNVCIDKEPDPNNYLDPRNGFAEFN